MPQAQSSLTSDEIMKRGKAVYEQNIRAHVETEENIGKFIVIEASSGDYLIGENHLALALRMREKHPDGVLCALRIGYPATTSRGVRMKPIQQ